MSTTIETILNRAMSDPEFADRLFNDPAAALAEYDLEEEVTTQFEKIAAVEVESMTLEIRKSLSLKFSPWRTR